VKYFFGIILNLLLICPSLVKGQLQSVFWEVSGNGLAHKSYLLGTVHVAPYTILKEFPLLLQTMRQAKLAIFENVGEIPAFVTSSTVVDYSPPLDSVFTKEEYTLVDSFFSRSEYGSIKPHNNNADLLAMVQATVLLLQNMKLNMRFDEYIIGYVKDSLQLPIMSLEKDTEQQQYKKKIASVRQYAEVIVKLIESAKAGMGKSFVGDSYLQKMQSDFLFKKKDTTYSTVAARNLLWLKKLEPALREQSCFIAVGLGHLEYESGLINLLRKKGYQLKPILLSRI
jgi:uncharacterized protein